MKPLKRTRLRFGLLSFLLFITAFCVLLGWKVERARKQREAVAWVREHRGLVVYGHESDRKLRPAGPKWLTELFGIDFLDDVVKLAITGGSLSDLSPLAGLTSVETLAIERFPGSDITPLADLTSLRALSLIDTQVRGRVDFSWAKATQKLIPRRHTGDRRDTIG